MKQIHVAASSEFNAKSSTQKQQRQVLIDFLA